MVVGTTLHVDYAYDDTADNSYRGLTSVFTKGMRPKSVKYPNGRLVHYTYGTGGLDDLLSRVAAIYDNNGGSPGSTAYAAYKRAGDGRIVEEQFGVPDSTGTPVVKLTYIGAATCARDYSGFDRFGRVVWQRWLRTGGASAADRHFYGYDRAGNRTWRAERADLSVAGGRDEAYVYDKLDRLIGAKRGILPDKPYQAPYPGDVTGNGVVDGSDSSVITANLGNSSRRWASGDLDGNGLVNSDDSAIYAANEGTPTGSVAAGRAWTLDATGNWEAYKVDNNGDGDYTDAGDLDQSRTHNLANEIYDATAGAAITETSGQSAWADPAYDARGNPLGGPSGMSAAPKPSAMTVAYACVYDAWNRLVEVYVDTDNDGVIDSGESVATYRYDGLGRRVRKYVPDGEDWTVSEFYYNAGWQLLETRKDGGVERTGSPLAEPAAVTAVYEQYVWSQRYIDAPVLRDRDSDNDPETGYLGQEGSGLDERLYYLTDAQMNVTALVDTGGDAVERYTYDAYGRVTIYDGTWTNTQSAATYANEVLYCGYRFDAETGFYHVRNRMYHPLLGRWLTRDPLGYVDGMSLYEYCRGNALLGLDPMGLGWIGDAWEGIKNTAEGLWEGAKHAVGIGNDIGTAVHALPGIAKIDAAKGARDLAIKAIAEGKDPEDDPNYVRLAKAGGISVSGKGDTTLKKDNDAKAKAKTNKKKE